MLTGDAANTDPVCGKSPEHGKILAARIEAEQAPRDLDELTFRNEKASQLIIKV